MLRQRHFYERLKSELKEKIQRGEYKPEEMLPSESELMRRYAVSCTTVRRALSDLAHEGLIYRKQGVGTFVAPPEKRAETYRIGLVFPYGLPTSSTDYSGSLFQAIRTELADQGHSLLIFTNKDEGYHRLGSENADGFVLLCPDDRDRETLEEWKRKGIPFVILGACWDDSDLACIGVDNAQGARVALSHFSQAGYRHIGLVHIAPLYFADHRERAEAFRRVACEVGLNSHNPASILSGTYQPEPVAKYREYLISLPRPAGILTTDAHLAARLLMAAADLNLRIPEDIGIISFDEVPLEIAGPVRFSILQQPLLEMAHRAVRRLMDALASRQPPTGSERFPVEFIHRRSCCL